MELDEQHVGYIAFELCKYLHPLIAADVVDVYCLCSLYQDFLFFLNKGGVETFLVGCKQHH
jgi:hypothetical protein